MSTTSSTPLFENAVKAESGVEDSTQPSMLPCNQLSSQLSQLLEHLAMYEAGQMDRQILGMKIRMSSSLRRDVLGALEACDKGSSLIPDSDADKLTLGRKLNELLNIAGDVR